MVVELPYTAIGKFTVAFFIAIGIEVLAFAGLLGWAILWVRFWTLVIRLMWKDGSVPDNPPEGWKRELSIYAWGFKHLKRPSEIHEKVKNAHRD